MGSVSCIPFVLLGVTCLFLLATATDSNSTVGYSIVAASSFTKVAQSNDSVLYNVSTSPPSEYYHGIQLLDLHGSRWQQGYDYGFLLAPAIYQNYLSLLSSLNLGKGVDEIVEGFVDWQYDSFLSKQIPEEFLEELEGLQAGGADAGYPLAGRYIQRGILLANFPGDVEDIVYVLEDELLHLVEPKELEAIRGWMDLLSVISSVTWKRLQCSMFGVWGSRTSDGSLYSARNLDWNKDTGVNVHKLVTVFHPPGKIAHVTVGFAGLYGALTGFSKYGISVHEANLEEKHETFRGFPWVLRLRYVMENARNLSEGISIWQSTNNTVGFNHMIASAVDAPVGPAAVALETMRDYTAYFFDNDTREASAVYYDKSTNETIQIGYPLDDAVYRTNHGYDPTIRRYYLWDQSPGSNPESSVNRYIDIYKAFKHYEQQQVKVSYPQAINITAIAAQKGPLVYHCQDNTNGSNVLSVVYHPMEHVMWAAWEKGAAEQWRPACCASYVRFDMSQWF